MAYVTRHEVSSLICGESMGCWMKDAYHTAIVVDDFEPLDEAKPKKGALGPLPGMFLHHFGL